jgi:hypothetical protein
MVRGSGTSAAASPAGRVGLGRSLGDASISLPENQKPSCSRACRARSRQVAHVTQPVLRSHMSLEGQRQHGARVGSSAPPPFVVRCRCARRPEGRKADPTSRPARWFALYESRFVLCSLSLVLALSGIWPF